jgi:hypothetical protein
VIQSIQIIPALREKAARWLEDMCAADKDWVAVAANSGYRFIAPRAVIAAFGVHFCLLEPDGILSRNGQKIGTAEDIIGLAPEHSRPAIFNYPCGSLGEEVWTC